MSPSGTLNENPFFYVMGIKVKSHKVWVTGFKEKHYTTKCRFYSTCTFEGDIGPAYARTVIGNSPGLFLSFQVFSILPENPPSVAILSPEISGDHGPPIQGGVELSIVPSSGIYKLSANEHMKQELVSHDHIPLKHTAEPYYQSRHTKTCMIINLFMHLALHNIELMMLL